MRKLVLLIPALWLSLMLASGAQAEVRVFACEPEWAALAEAIGAGQVKVTAATNALQDPHYIQARPSLIASVRRADLLVCSGADLEIGWLPLLLRKGNNPAVQPGKAGFMIASQYVKRLEVPAQLDRAMGDQHAQGNPHIQTDPHNIALVATELSRRLQQIDPAHAGAYRDSLADFQQRWSEAIARWEALTAPLRGSAVVVHHKSWAYLNHWLGFREVATLESKPGVPPSAAHLETLLNQLQTEPAQIIIRTPYQDSRPSEWLAGRVDIPAVALPFTVGGADGADNLFGLFDTTVQLLLDNLQVQHGR